MLLKWDEDSQPMPEHELRQAEDGTTFTVPEGLKQMLDDAFKPLEEKLNLAGKLQAHLDYEKALREDLNKANEILEERLLERDRQLLTINKKLAETNDMLDIVQKSSRKNSKRLDEAEEMLTDMVQLLGEAVGLINDHGDLQTPSAIDLYNKLKFNHAAAVINLDRNLGTPKKPVKKPDHPGGA